MSPWGLSLATNSRNEGNAVNQEVNLTKLIFMRWEAGETLNAKEEVGESSEESMQTWHHTPVVAEPPQCHPCSDAPRDKPSPPAGRHFYFSPWE